MRLRGLENVFPIKGYPTLVSSQKTKDSLASHVASSDDAAVLWIAATPLGNLDDISERLRTSLRLCDVVYAEDTRRSRILLEHLEIHKPLKSLHAHNELQRGDDVLRHLAQGDRVVLLTDAGTPAVSDPGAKTIERAHQANYRVSPIPGPSALTAALSVAGFSSGSQAILFTGFWPRANKEQREALAVVENHPGQLVFFESPLRLLKTLESIVKICPTRWICVCREMTKIHEECIRGTVLDVCHWARKTTVRGEITVVLGPAVSVSTDEEDADAQTEPMQGTTVAQALKRCLEQGLSVKDASQAVSAIFQKPRRDVYQLALEMNKA